MVDTADNVDKNVMPPVRASAQLVYWIPRPPVSEGTWFESCAGIAFVSPSEEISRRKSLTFYTYIDAPHFSQGAGSHYLSCICHLESKDFHFHIFSIFSAVFFTCKYEKIHFCTQCFKTFSTVHKKTFRLSVANRI